MAGIEIEGAERRVLRPADGLLVRDAAGAELAKSLRESGPGAALPAGAARVDTRERTLILDGADFRLRAG